MKSTVQTVTLARPVVAETERGALGLADPYWSAIRRLTAGLAPLATVRSCDSWARCRSFASALLGPRREPG
jgi:hypothetical protein